MGNLWAQQIKPSSPRCPPQLKDSISTSDTKLMPSTLGCFPLVRIIIEASMQLLSLWRKLPLCIQIQVIALVAVYTYDYMMFI